MNPTRKPKKPKQIVDKPRKTNKPKKPKSMKKGGGGWNWEKKIPETHRPPDIKWSTKYRVEHPPKYTTIDLLRDKTIASCKRLGNKIAECIIAYNQWQKEKREEKERKKRREERDKKIMENEKEVMEMNSQQTSHHSQSQRSSPLTSSHTSQHLQSHSSQSHSSQSHSSHLLPIQEELQPTKRNRLSLKPLPPPQQPQQQMRRLRSLPPQQPQQQMRRLRRLLLLPLPPQLSQVLPSSRSSNK